MKRPKLRTRVQPSEGRELVCAHGRLYPSRRGAEPDWKGDWDSTCRWQQCDTSHASTVL